MATLVNELETAAELEAARAAYRANRDDEECWRRVHAAGEAYLVELRTTLEDSVQDQAFAPREHPRVGTPEWDAWFAEHVRLNRAARSAVRRAAEHAGVPPYIAALEAALDLSDEEFTTPFDSSETRYTALARIAEWTDLQCSIAPAGESA